MKKLIIAVLIIVAIGAILLLSNKPSNAPIGDKPTVKIAALFPMTGDAGVYGQISQKVSKMFLDEFNKNNPKAKYNYEVIFEDVQLSSAKAVSALKKVVHIDKADAIMSVQSSVALVINPEAEKNKIIQLSFASDPAVAKGEYNFRIGADIKQVVDMTIARMKKQGIKKVSAVILVGDVASYITGKAFEEQMKKEKDIELGSVSLVNFTDKNFDVIIEKIKKENSDMILLEALPPVSDLFLRRMKMLNLNIPVTGAWTLASLSDKSLAEGMWAFDDAVTDPVFEKKFQETIGATGGTFYSEYTYAILTVLTNAWENTPSEPGKKPTSEEVVKTMMKKTKGLKSSLGTLDIDQEGNVTLQGVIKTIKNGNFIIEKE